MNAIEYLPYSVRHCVYVDSFSPLVNSEENIKKIHEHAVSTAEWIRGPVSAAQNREYDPLGEMGDAVEVVTFFKDAFKWIPIPGPFIVQEFDEEGCAFLVKDGAIYKVKGVGRTPRDAFKPKYDGKPLSGANVTIYPWYNCLFIDTGRVDEEEGIDDFDAVRDACGAVDDHASKDASSALRLSAMFDLQYHPCFSLCNSRRQKAVEKRAAAVAKQEKGEVCANCGGGDAKKLQACGRCKVAKYCGVECQKANWKHHKGMCKQMADLVDELK